MTDEQLAELGRISHEVYWKTPVFSTYSISDSEERKSYQRRNEIARGSALTARLFASGYTLCVKEGCDET